MRVLQWLAVAGVLSCTSAVVLHPLTPTTAQTVTSIDYAHVSAPIVIPWTKHETRPVTNDRLHRWRPQINWPRLPIPYLLRAQQVATDEYVTAIESALASVDPEGLHPEWGDALYRICRRESRCGQYGPVGIHEVDSWTGARSYAWAVHRGKLSPETCEAHRLQDYAPVLKSLHEWERQHGREHPARARLDSMPLGSRRAQDFSTRGGWGMNAARGLHWLGSCVGPETMDTPRAAALVAAKEIAACEVGERACTCAEQAALWAGRGRWASRPLFARQDKGRSKFTTVAVQCGRKYAIVFAVVEPLRAAKVRIRQIVRALGFG